VAGDLAADLRDRTPRLRVRQSLAQPLGVEGALGRLPARRRERPVALEALRDDGGQRLGVGGTAGAQARLAVGQGSCS
jgi:hypothetical protein